MSKLIALSGSHGVGKTTLFAKLADKVSDNDMDYKLFSEVNSGLFNLGFALNGEGNPDDIFFSQQVAFDVGYAIIDYYSTKSDNTIVILDRSCIDTYIYTKYFFDNSEIEVQNKYINMLNQMEIKCQSIVNYINNVIIYPFSQFNTKNRMDYQSQSIIHQYFLDYFDQTNTECLHIAIDSFKIRINNIINQYKLVI